MGFLLSRPKRTGNRRCDESWPTARFWTIRPRDLKITRGRKRSKLWRRRGGIRWRAFTRSDTDRWARSSKKKKKGRWKSQSAMNLALYPYHDFDSRGLALFCNKINRAEARENRINEPWPREWGTLDYAHLPPKMNQTVSIAAFKLSQHLFLLLFLFL